MELISFPLRLPELQCTAVFQVINVAFILLVVPEGQTLDRNIHHGAAKWLKLRDDIARVLAFPLWSLSCFIIKWPCVSTLLRTALLFQVDFFHQAKSITQKPSSQGLSGVYRLHNEWQKFCPLDLWFSRQNRITEWLTKWLLLHQQMRTPGRKHILVSH